LTAKGYTFTKVDDDGDLDYSGTLDGNAVTLYALMTPAPNRGLVKIFIGVLTSDEHALAEFASLRNTLIAQYGQPSISGRRFDSPYVDGDGNEQTAIKDGKGHIAAIWKNTSNDITTGGLTILVSDKLTVNSAYESPAWNTEADRRAALTSIADNTAALKVDSNDASAYVNRGRARQMLDDPQGAISDFARALKADSTYSSAYVNLTVARGTLGDFAAALADADSALRVDPKDAFGYEARSYTHLALGEGVSATSDALAALHMREPSNQHFLYGIIVGYLGLRQTGSAQDAATFLATWAPKADSTMWPYAVVQYFQHKVTGAALLAGANDSDQMTEARTYLALDLILAGTPQAARPQLAWVRQNGTRTYFEYPVALAALKRLPPSQASH
jgi:tetratricopeptide (TPR) repeat protein